MIKDQQISSSNKPQPYNPIRYISVDKVRQQSQLFYNKLQHLHKQQLLKKDKRIEQLQTKLKQQQKVNNVLTLEVKQYEIVIENLAQQIKNKNNTNYSYSDHLPDQIEDQMEQEEDTSYYNQMEQMDYDNHYLEEQQDDDD